MTVYLNELGIVNALGLGQHEVLANMLAGSQENIRCCNWVPNVKTYTAQVRTSLPEISEDFLTKYGLQFNSRNNQLALCALNQLRDALQVIKSSVAAERIAVVLGTSTSGIAEAENAVAEWKEKQLRSPKFRYQQIELGSLAEFVALQIGSTGPAYVISTACSSSGHAFKSAKSLLENDMADIVITGGVDSLCRLTVNGFSALESVSDEITNPFSVNRKGINIGEGAALFILSREADENAIELMGVGTSSDAHHISAPQPDGEGAERAIRAALGEAALSPENISYVNLHGTGTYLNDEMESKVISRLFGSDCPCSSSKGQIGHTLGAAAASEVALCWLSLSRRNSGKKLPPHRWDGRSDPALPRLKLVECGDFYSGKPAQAFLSNSFAFGGNNAAVIIGRRKA